MIDFNDLSQAIEEARRFRHPSRSMRVVLECAHMRLMAWDSSAMGIGASTKCPICPEEPTRLVVDVQETGMLHDSYKPKGAE